MGIPGPGSLLHLPGSRTSLLLLQARHHVGARRNYGTRGRLSGEVRARLRPQGRSRRRAEPMERSFGGEAAGAAAGHRLGRNVHRRTAAWMPREWEPARAAADPTKSGPGEAWEPDEPEPDPCATGDAAEQRRQRTTAAASGAGLLRSGSSIELSWGNAGGGNGSLLSGCCGGRLKFGNRGMRVGLERAAAAGSRRAGWLMPLEGLGFGNRDGAAGFAAHRRAAPPCTLCRMISATGSSMELEWVFFSVTPSSGNMSMMA